MNLADPRLPFLERPAGKFGPWLAFGNIDFGRVLTIPEMVNGLLCKAVIYAGHLEFWYMLGEE